jgi:hypothetical protein
MRFIVRTMGAVLVALALAVTAAPAPANAATRNCFGMPALMTGYGPVKMCYQYADGREQAGYYSTIQGSFAPLTGLLPIGDHGAFSFTATASDGRVGDVHLGDQLQTGYGPASWGIQYKFANHSLARFGSYNAVTGLFYPSSGYLSVV